MPKKSPQNLIPLSREVHFDDTLREFNAVLRIDTKIEDSNLKAQLLIDLRHKKQPRLSKPRFYGTISKPRQFEDLVSASLAMACFHRLRKKEELTDGDILLCYDEMTKWLRGDVRSLVQVMYRDVKRKQAETLG